MERIVKSIPNTLTLANLISGCAGIIFLIKGDLITSVYLMWLAAVLDFLDGFAARSLNAYSAMGKQLDSLADMISFGALPALILFIMISENTEIKFLPYLSFSVAAFSAVRLARFNLDEDQNSNFEGIPTPASALLISGLAIWSQTDVSWMNYASNNSYFLIATGILLSWLMVSKIKFPSLKIENFNLKSNIFILVLILASILLIGIYGFSAIALIFYLSIVLALIRHVIKG